MLLRENSYGMEMKGHVEQLAALNSGATFYSAELHCHTPGSINDQYSFGGIKYIDVSYSELENQAKMLGILHQDMGVTWESTEQEKKDWIAPAIIVAHAYHKDIRLLVITDHDSCDWYKRIKNCVRSVRSSLKKEYTLRILPGAEITAHSGIHVIAIVSPENFESLQLYLKVLEYKKSINKPALVSEIIDEIVDNLHGLIYIPHVDSNDLIKNSTDIKKTIFANCKVSAVAVKNPKQQQYYQNLITTKEYQCSRRGKLAFIQDSDAHCTEDIGAFPIWLKMTCPSYAGLLHALTDPEVRVAKEPPQIIEHPYIMGMAFLDSPVCKDRAKWYYVKFNPLLNCLIGPRGSGKSTIINWITSAFAQRLDSYSQREWYANFGRVLLFLSDDTNTFVIDINPPDIASEKYKRHQETGPVEIDYWITVRQILPDGRIKKVSDKDTFFRNVYSNSFKQTAVESLAADPHLLHETFLDFLQLDKNRWTQYCSVYLTARESMLDGLHKIGYDTGCSTPQSFGNRLNQSFSIFYGAMKCAYEVEKDFAKFLNSTVLKNKLEIKVFLEIVDDHCINEIVGMIDCQLELVMKKAMRLHITEVAEYVFRKNGHHQGLIDLFLLSAEQMAERYNIEQYLPSLEKIDSGESSISIEEIIVKMRNAIFQKANGRSLASILKCVPKVSVELLHNINYGKSLEKKDSRFVEMHKLSLGQKCVAILSFIIDVSELLGDKRPLIIDQPEDHLDNRYIYDYLVNDLRRVKKARQVILSTHNANIPVCADAEQILVMNSNGSNMWVDYCGSLDFQDLETNTKMTTLVQELLEGGITAFELREKKYQL